MTLLTLQTTTWNRLPHRSLASFNAGRFRAVRNAFPGILRDLTLQLGLQRFSAGWCMAAEELLRALERLLPQGAPAIKEAD